MDIIKEIMGWGLPKALDNIDVEYEFEEGSESEFGTKFHLVEKNSNKEILIMDFFSSTKHALRAFNETEKWMKLQFIYVSNPMYRKKGIASYYLDRLGEHCKKCNIKKIKVHVVLNPKDIKNYSSVNAISSKEHLIQFYRKHLGSDPEVELIIDNE